MHDLAPEQVTPPAAEMRGRFRKGRSGNPAGRPKKIAHQPEPIDQTRVDAWVDGLQGAGAPGSTRADGGWTSMFTGIGTSEYDKRQTYYVEPKRLSYQQIINLWAQDELGERAITAPPAECMRPGYEIVIKDEGNFETLKDQIEDKLIALEADAKIEEVHCLERAFGGGAILLGIKDGRRFDQPLDVANVKSFDWLTVLEPIELQAETYYVDPNEAKYGLPKHYRLNSTISLASQFTTVSGGGAQRAAPPNAPLIHESRLIIFNGDRISKYQLFPNLDLAPCWGQSKCVRWVDALRDYHIGYSSAGLIANDFSQSVISIDGLIALLAKKDGEDRLRARMRAIEMSRSTARAVIIDAKEKYERQSTSVTGLADLLDRLNKHVAAAIDMPLSLLMGYEGGSLGSENEGDIRFYYDRIRTMTTKKVVPALRTIITYIIPTLRQRKIPKKWSVVFNELWQETEAQKAERKLTDARADSLRIKSGTIYPDESRNRHKGEYQTELQIDPSKKAPGITMLGPGGTAAGGLLAEAKGAPTAAGKTTATGHAVRPYARRNPIQKTTPSAKIGGNGVPSDRVDGDVVTWRQFAGLAIAIECPKGTTRTWTQQDGRMGATKMRYDYGYIGGATGADGEEVDCYLGPSEQAEFAYVVHQNAPPDFIVYDEDKVMLGFDSPNHARDAYIAQYDDARFFGGMTMIKMDDLRALLRDESRDSGNPITYGDGSDDVQEHVGDRGPA